MRFDRQGMMQMSTSKMNFRVGTRGSRLSRIQTRDALDRLEALFPACSFVEVPVSSPGDRDQITDLRQSPADFFTQDLDQRVLRGELDCAIHSAKDVPDPMATGLDWFWLPGREDPRDVLIRPRGQTLDSMPVDCKIGVSSERRASYCRSRFPQARPCTIRGVIEERIQQLDQGAFDLVIMAGAALNRLGMQDRITEWIPENELMPPEGQGVLAFSFRAGDPRFQQLRRLFVKSVTFVAAGAGSAGTCTLECLHALQRCDICLHDALLGHDLLALLPSSVRCIDVGKRCGQHSLPQDETTAMIARYARRGMKVARLKGGDPGIFGRLAEEVEALDALALPYRVLSGVSSLNAATSATGMLLTRRGVSRGFTVMTPRREGGGTDSVASDARLKLPMVFFMALAVAEEICHQLGTEGFGPHTPASVVWGAGSDQARILSGTLGNIAEQIKAAACEMPGLLIVGDAAKFRFANWGALKGRRVLLTASQALQDKAADLVSDYGGIPVCRPLVKREAASEALDCIRRIDSYDWVVLTSPSAVRCFGELLRTARMDLRTVPALVTCGGGTSKELSSLGLSANLAPEADFGSESLLKTVAPRVKPGLRILRLRSDKAGPDLALSLRGMGATVDDCILYRNRPITYVEKPDFDVVFFASASAVEAFVQQWRAASLMAKFVVAIGKPTLAALAKCGVAVDLVPPEATVESSMETLAANFVRQEIIS